MLWECTKWIPFCWHPNFTVGHINLFCVWIFAHGCVWGVGVFFSSPRWKTSVRHQRLIDFIDLTPGVPFASEVAPSLMSFCGIKKMFYIPQSSHCGLCMCVLSPSCTLAPKKHFLAPKLNSPHSAWWAHFKYICSTNQNAPIQHWSSRCQIQLSAGICQSSIIWDT